MELFDFGSPVDLLVYTTDEINDRKKNPYRLISRIVTEGVVLYART